MASEIYSSELSILQLGHAVWDPNPNDLYKRVRVGDVGYFQDGVFIPLFNVLLPAGDPSHERWGVPDEFLPLQLPGPAIRTKSPLVPGSYHSRSVRELNVSGSISGVQAVNAELSFNCTKEKGAVLVLPHPALREEALYRKRFKDYMLANYRQWFTFAVDCCGCEIKVSDLILVTGCDMTTQWAMAAFSRSNFRGSGTLGVEGPSNGMAAKFSLGGGWTTSGFVHHHWGPLHREDYDASTQKRLISSEEEGPDQCVFVRGYRVKERIILGPTVMEAAAGYHDIGGGDREQGEAAACLASDEIELLSEPPKDTNLLLPILDYILEKSDATVAIAHDDNIWPYIESSESYSSGSEYLHLILKNKRPSIIVQNSIGSLRTEDNGSLASTHTFTTSATVPSDIMPNRVSKSWRNIDPVIDNKLYLGNISAARSTRMTTERRITHILSVCKEHIPAELPESGITHGRIPVEDADDQDLLIYLPMACRFIENALSQGGIVLVHSSNGASRSAAVVAAYLMQSRGWNATIALNTIKEARDNIWLNPGFQEQLVLFELCNYAPSPANMIYNNWKSNLDLRKRTLSSDVL